LDAVDLIVMPTTPDIPALRNVRLFFEVSEQLGYPPDKIAMVLNKSDPRRSRIRASDIEESLKHPVLVEVPMDDVMAMASINQGVPFVVSDGSRPISQAVTRLAEKILEAWAAVEEAQQAEEMHAMEDPARRRLGRFFR
jgi:pilus assembly protein CpaE